MGMMDVFRVIAKVSSDDTAQEGRKKGKEAEVMVSFSHAGAK
jgi:hypothetical protein